MLFRSHELEGLIYYRNSVNALTPLLASYVAGCLDSDMMIRSASIKGIRQLCEESAKLITNENKESKYLFLCSIHL